MSYAVIHMQKFKMGGVRGIQNHNDRLKESRTNPDIDYEKSKLNKKLDNQPDDKTYYNRIRDRIKELDLPKAVRKDAVVMCGFICTSDKAFFEKLPQDQQEKFFQESYKFLKDRYGEKNIVAATVHYDETTPHMHYYMVPVTPDGRLSAKDIFTPTELKRLQTEYHQHLRNAGFELERGKSSDRKHLSVQEFKHETIEKTKAELAKLQEVKTYVKLDVKKGALGYSTKDVEELKTLAEAQRLENYDMKQTIRQQENKIANLENNLQIAQKRLEDIKPLLRELETLKNENRALQEYLDRYPQAMKELEKYMSFKKQVHKEGNTLAELKEKYVEVSAMEHKYSQAMNNTTDAYNKITSRLKDLDTRQQQLEKLSGELNQYQNQRQEIGKISFKNAFKGFERKNLDRLIGQTENRFKQATEDLQRVHEITPGQIDTLKKDLQEKADKLHENIKEQQQTIEKLQTVKEKLRQDYKFLKAKTGLYSEPYRNIVNGKEKHIAADYRIDKELNTLSKADQQQILDRLPESLKDRFQKQVQEIKQPKAPFKGIER